jgi:hypothetical protein
MRCDDVLFSTHDPNRDVRLVRSFLCLPGIETRMLASPNRNKVVVHTLLLLPLFGSVHSSLLGPIQLGSVSTQPGSTKDRSVGREMCH